MTPEEMENLLGHSVLQGQQQQSALVGAQQQTILAEEERGLAETQLDVETIISRIYHLLRQDVYREKQDGTCEWTVLVNQQARTLSDWGVDRIMQVVNFYINKNNLLSNYDEKQINRIMKQFLVALNNLMLHKYEILFNEPSFEECKRILQERLDNKKKVKVFASELLGIKADEAAIEKELMDELEKRIEYEFEKVKVEKRKENIREYELIIVQLDAIVYAAYNRAYRGEERGSIRRHTNISEIIGKPMQNPNQNKGGAFGWLRG